MEHLFNPLDHPILLARPRRLTPFSAWHEHIPAAMLLVDLLRPETLVELGTHYGDSYCAFCQAVQELHLGTQCYAVDTWQGDPQTGFYGPEVLEDLRLHHDPLYGNFSALVQSTFDEALGHFGDGTIDLLHIDGFHTYDAVHHDFESWFGKLSNRAVVLFHDINVRGGDFGVWRLWKELAARFPHSDFAHGHGLGILAVGGEQPAEFARLLPMSEEEKTRTRNLMFQLGNRLELETRIASLEKEKALQRLGALVAEKEGIVQGFSDQVAQQEQTLQALNQQLEEKERTIKSLQRSVEEQTEHIDALVTRIDFLSTRDSELRTLLLDAHAQLVDRDNEIQRLRQEGIPLSQGIEALGKRLEYRQLIGRIRKVAADTLPPKARVAVVSKGDDQLLSLNGCEGWHFPQSVDGVYSGYYPADSESAISELETLRSRGAEYLLFPSTCFWWLEHYAGFKRHLDRRYKMIARNQDVCIIYSLAKRTPKRASGGTARRAPAQTQMKAKR